VGGHARHLPVRRGHAVLLVGRGGVTRLRDVMTEDGYATRFAAPDEVVRISEIERLASVLFEDRLHQTGLTPKLLECVSAIDELAQAKRRRRLGVALFPDGPLVDVALVKEAAWSLIWTSCRSCLKTAGSRLSRTVCESASQAGDPHAGRDHDRRRAAASSRLRAKA